MTDSEQKKLGVSKGTLGIAGKLGVTSSPSAAPARPALPQNKSSSQSSKGKVLVVTKTRRGGGFQEKPMQDNLDLSGLTLNERDKRLAVLQRATEESKRQTELKAQKQQQVESTQPVADEPAPEPSTQEPAAPVAAAPRPQVRRDLSSIMSAGKVRNLDSLYKPMRAAKPQEVAATPAKEDEKPSQDSKFERKKIKTPEETEAEKNSRRAEEEKRGGKISIAQVLMMDDESGGGLRRRSMASIRRARDKARKKYERFHGADGKASEKIIREVLIPDVLTVQELANRMAEKSIDVVKALMKLGMMVTVNQTIDADTAELVTSEFGHKFKRVTEHEIEASFIHKIEDSNESLTPRAPVVTIMGHVDHGKTSLLDALRQTDVAAGEAGGITQHIGAYRVTMHDGRVITFLDTPGHEAFTAMRMRGAKVTDIVVLVVAADDGIMPQTIEAISHAKAANVPIIVAINKIDKPEANPTRVKQELLSHNLVPEDMGGDVMVIEVSAKQKLNLDKLEETILLQADVLELKANPNRLAEGAVVEARMDKGRGAIATLLVQKGTMRVGDIVVAGTSMGKIKALTNDKGKRIEFAEPSTPVEILGLDNAPTAGDEFIVCTDEKAAKELVDFRSIRERQKRIVASKQLSLEQLFSKAKAEGAKDLPIIIKADVQGSVEAIANSLEKLNTSEISVKILHAAVGGITESDIALASASNALVLAFNVRASAQARDLGKINGTDIKYYSIIYNLIDDIKAAMGGMLAPTRKETFVGYAEIREVIVVTRFGKVAGCYVTEGTIKRHSNVRLLRDSVVVHDGKLKALKRFKDDVKEVNFGFECGMTFENYDDIKVGDRIEAYEVTEEARTL